MFAYTKIIQGIQAVTTAVTDAYFNLVTLLLNTTSTNGAQNNTFLDSSSNNFTVTRNGNTTQGTFTPFSQTGWSTYFNGVDQKIASVAGTNFAYGTGAFTVEAFVFLSGYKAVAQLIFSQTVSGTNYFNFQITTTGQLEFNYATSGGGTYVTSTTTIPVGTWAHVAAVRQGTGTNQFALYINGTNVATSTVAQDFSNTTYNPTIGDYTHTNFLPFFGYISNIRVIKGQALTTGNFTSPTSALSASTVGWTGANAATSITGTVSLLAMQSNRFVDNGAGNTTLTLTGTPSVQAFSPFLPTAAYSTTTVGGSGYFDGTGDYLSIADNSLLEPGSSAFTLECWFYSTANPPANGAAILTKSATSSFGPFAILIDPSTKYINGLASTTGSSWNISISSTTVAALNTWYHVALVRSGSNFALFINGTRAATTTNAGTLINNTDAFMVGYDNYASTNFTGYVSSVRYVVGTAVYDPTLTTCTIPTAPANPSGSTLCINYTNSGIYDAAAKNDLETVGNAQVSTTQAKFGTTSMYFDGTGDYLKIPSNVQLAFGTGNFTIEFFIYFNVVNAAQTIIDFRPDATGNSASPYLELTSGGAIIYYLSGGVQITTSALSANTWYHVALVRNGSNNIIYINGTQSGSTFSNSSSLLQSGITVGFNKNNGGTSFQYLNAYMDDLRITTGNARYTANFTAPTAAFPVQ